MLPEINQIKPENILKSQLNHQVSQIGKLIAELQGQHSKTKRSINWIGSAWKWIAGSPDATDWDEILKSQNKIIENNNEQYKVNKALMNTANQILNEYNKVVKQVNKESTEAVQQLMFNRLSIVKEEIKEVVRAAQLAKGGIINTNLLDKQEVNRLIAEIETLPYSNEIEAIEYAEPIMMVKNSIILYVMSVPKTNKTDYNHILLRSTIHDNKQVHLEYTDLLANHDKLFGIIKKCNLFKETLICQANQLQELHENHCINQLMKGLNAGCDLQFNRDEVIEPLNKNTIFLSNFNGTITCNNSSRHLEGSFLIQLHKETVLINGKTFANTEVKTSQILPPVLQANLTEKSTKLDLKYLHSLHLNSIERLQELFTAHKKTIITDISIVMMIIILVVAFSAINIRNRRQKLVLLATTTTNKEETAAPIGPVKLNF